MSEAARPYAPLSNHKVSGFVENVAGAEVIALESFTVKRRNTVYTWVLGLCCLVSVFFLARAPLSGQTADTVLAEFHPAIESRQDPLFPGLAYPRMHHPTIGLALSGGGLKGIAHIGVLKALEEANIPIDYIAGTSAGSIVGGLYALGYPVEAIDSIAQAIDYQTIFIDQPQRRNLFVSQKMQASKYLADIRFERFKPYIPISLTPGQAIGDQLVQLFLHSPYSTIQDFDHYRVPFRAVSTELETGNRRVLREGNWVEALRASSSVPMVLSPVPLDGKRLIDGGVSDNIPIDLARDIGSDFVIAVDVRAQLYQPEELQNLLLIADQVINILINANRQEVIKNADVIINPDFNNTIPPLDNEAEASIYRGYMAAKQQIPEIKRKYQRLFPESDRTFVIDTILVRGNQNLSDANIREIARTQAITYPATVTGIGINSMLRYLINSGYFADADARVIREGKGQQHSALVLRVKEHPLVHDTYLNGVTQISDSTIFHRLEVMNGIPYNPRMLKLLLTDVITRYRDQGFPMTKVDTVRWDPDGGIIQASLSEGWLGKVSYEGNRLSKEFILSREVTLEPGEIITSKGVRQSLSNLYSTELFDYVGVNFRPIPDRNRWEMRFKLREKKYQGVKLGYRVDNQRGDAGLFALEHQNFQGDGIQMLLESKIGVNDRYVQSHFSSNRFFKTYVTYDFEFGHEWHRYRLFQESTPNQNHYYNLRRTYGAFTLGHQLARLGLVNMMFKHQEVSLTGPLDLARYNAHYHLSTITLQSIIDTKDRAAFPRAGNYQKILYEIASRKLGGDIGYTKFEFASDWYFTFANRHTIHPGVRVEVGDETMPFSEWFSLGGLNSFMGLEEYEIYGSKLYLGKLEYRYMIPVSSLFNLYLFAEYDLAGITDDVLYALNKEDFFNGRGIGVGASSPVGPLRLAFGRDSRGDEAFYIYLGWDF